MRLLLVGLFLQLCTPVAAQQERWVSLFNGKDLSGWKPLNGKARFEVRDGMIIGTTVPNEPNSFLATEKEYKDFTLELEFEADSTMNSGIQFRSESRPDYLNGRVHGYQMEIDPSDRAWSGGIYDEGRRLWLYTLEYNPVAKTAYKRKGWNKYRIECDGNTVRTWVNGVPAAYLVDDMDTRGFIALVARSAGAISGSGRANQPDQYRIFLSSTSCIINSPRKKAGRAYNCSGTGTAPRVGGAPIKRLSRIRDGPSTMVSFPLHRRAALNRPSAGILLPKKCSVLLNCSLSSG